MYNEIRNLLLSVANNESKTKKEHKALDFQHCKITKLNLLEKDKFL